MIDCFIDYADYVQIAEVLPLFQYLNSKSILPALLGHSLRSRLQQVIQQSQGLRGINLITKLLL